MYNQFKYKVLELVVLKHQVLSNCSSNITFKHEAGFSGQEGAMETTERSSIPTPSPRCERCLELRLPLNVSMVIWHTRRLPPRKLTCWRVMLACYVRRYLSSSSCRMCMWHVWFSDDCSHSSCCMCICVCVCVCFFQLEIHFLVSAFLDACVVCWYMYWRS